MGLVSCNFAACENAPLTDDQKSRHRGVGFLLVLRRHSTLAVGVLPRNGIIIQSKTQAFDLGNL